MKFSMQRLAACAIACVALAFAAGTARAADDYPNHPVRWLVGYPPGGSTDIVARLIGQYLSEHLGQQFVIENKPGAGNNLATEMATRADPDGYTVLLVNPANAINATLYKNLTFNFIRDMAPVAGIIRVPNVMEVNPNVPAKTVAEFISYAKANPGKVNFSSGGVGVLPHLIGEMFKARAGIDIVHVPYRGGGPSIADVMGGQVDLTFEGTSVLLPLIQAGKLRALAVTSAKRIPQLPDVPTMIESGYPGFSSTSWTGLLAPAKTPPEIIARLNAQVNAALTSPEITRALAAISSEPLGGPPQALTEVIKADVAKWAPIVKSLNLQTD
jgi:tripartite-type tricarboxylate transporter receptor subunit TctC